MKTEQNPIKDAAKAIIVLTLIITAMTLFFGLDVESTSETDLRLAGAMLCGATAMILSRKWYGEEQDEKSGINQAVRDEIDDAKH